MILVFNRIISRSIHTSSKSGVKSALWSSIQEQREQVSRIKADYGEKVLCNVTVNMVYGGMRGIKGLLHETSLLDSEHGIRFRGYSIDEIREKLPTSHKGSEPLPEGLFYLLLTGKIPNKNDVEEIQQSWMERASRPNKALDKVLNALPKTLHPMSQLSIALLAMQEQSIFAQKYAKGQLVKDNLWDATYEDTMDLIASLPRVIGRIFHNANGSSNFKEIDSVAIKEQDWSVRLAKYIGLNSEKAHEFLRLYMSIHTDHEGGNVSAHATHLVGSALSDPYLSYSAGLNGLAGPLHGRACQEVLEWIDAMALKLGPKPSKEAIIEYIWSTLKSGRVVPGYGHAVLRKTDPRYEAQREFALKHVNDDSGVHIVHTLYDVVPKILTEHGKTKNPWPNVDAHSGVILRNIGLPQQDFYTVLFGMSRSIGALAGLIWDRALGLPIERPKSMTSDSIIQTFKGK